MTNGLLEKTTRLAAERGWSEWVLYMMMLDYLRQADFLEEFHEFALEVAKLEDQQGQ